MKKVKEVVLLKQKKLKILNFTKELIIELEIPRISMNFQ